MCVCLCVYTYTHTDTYPYIYIHIHVLVYIYTKYSLCMIWIFNSSMCNIWIAATVCIYFGVCIHIQYLYIYTYTCTHVHATYTYIYKQIHIFLYVILYDPKSPCYCALFREDFGRKLLRYLSSPSWREHMVHSKIENQNTGRLIDQLRWLHNPEGLLHFNLWRLLQ